MFRNLSSPATPPLSLRRRHWARQEIGFECGSRWAGVSSDFDEGHGDLDLSIHHSTSPFSTQDRPSRITTISSLTAIDNRFEGLASPPPALVRDRDLHSSSTRRRARNSRGTREAKKRRDARRNERKHAAQMLDEQLSKDIDEILANANVSSPTQASQPLPTPILPTTSFSQQLWDLSSLPPLPPTPPQLPPLNFSQWNVNDFPPLTWQQPTFAQPPSQFSPMVPNWCPYIPSLISHRKWSGKTPSFTDLSHLPERKQATPKAEMQQELRPWTTDLVLRPRKQSRFFPASRLPQPTVKLPPTACKLHHSEEAIQNPLTTAWNLPPRPSRPDVSTTQSDEIVMPAQESPSSPEPNLPLAANLWHILINEKLESLRPQVRGCDSCWETEYEEDGGVSLPATVDEQTQPFELDSKEVPYVHRNSLTGHANDTARYHSDCSDNEDMTDSTIHLAEAFMSREGDTYNYELAAMPWPLFPREQSPVVTRARSPDVHFVDNAENVHTNTDADDLARSADHFVSERILFDEPIATNNIEESTCDLATFLKMGHVENCWCTQCYEEPELVNEEPQSPVQLTEEEGWMTWSSAEDGSNWSNNAPIAMLDNTTDEEKETTRHPCTRPPEWDDMFPYVPKRLRVESVVETEAEEDGEFLGYYDDGAAFARENDYDWLWNL